MEGVLFNDLMANIAWLFSVHDTNKDGYLSKEEVLQLSESLLFIFRNEPGDQYLAAVSAVSVSSYVTLSPKLVKPPALAKCFRIR